MTEALNLGEYPKRHIDYLPEQLGFKRTPEMATLQALLSEAMVRGGEDEAVVLAEYRRVNDQIIGGIERQDQNAARVGANIARALTFRDAGRFEEYRECVEDLLYDLDNLIASGLDEFTEARQALEAEL